MWSFLAKRTAYSIFVLLGVSLLSFLLLHLTGDPATALMPIGTPPEQIAAFRQQSGLDRPLLIQFTDYLGKAVQGDFGMSLRHRESAMGLVVERLPATLRLGLASPLTVLIAVPLDLAAIHKDSGSTTPASWRAARRCRRSGSPSCSSSCSASCQAAAHLRRHWLKSLLLPP